MRARVCVRTPPNLLIYPRLVNGGLREGDKASQRLQKTETTCAGRGGEAEREREKERDSFWPISLQTQADMMAAAAVPSERIDLLTFGVNDERRPEKGVCL